MTWPALPQRGVWDAYEADPEQERRDALEIVAREQNPPPPPVKVERIPMPRVLTDEEQAALAAQQQAAPEPEPIVTSQWSRDVAPARYTPAEAAQMQGAISAAQIRAVRGREDQLRLARERATIAGQYKTAAERHLQQTGGRADATYKKLQEADAQIADLTKRIDATQIDPDRKWKEMGAGRQAMAVIAVALGGLAKGLSGGKVESQAIGILERAFERDIAAQQVNLQKQMQRLGLSQQQRAALLGQWQHEEGARREQAKDVYTYQLHKLAAQEQAPQIKAAYSNLALQLGRMRIDVSADSRQKVTTRSGGSKTTGKAGAGAGPKPKDAPVSVKERVTGLINARQAMDRQLRDLGDVYSGGLGWGVSTVNRWGKSHDLEKNRRILSAGLAKARDPSPDVQLRMDFRDAVPGPSDTREMQVWKHQRAIEENTNTLRSLQRLFPNDPYIQQQIGEALGPAAPRGALKR